MKKYIVPQMDISDLKMEASIAAGSANVYNDKTAPEGSKGLGKEDFSIWEGEE